MRLFGWFVFRRMFRSATSSVNECMNPFRTEFTNKRPCGSKFNSSKSARALFKCLWDSNGKLFAYGTDSSTFVRSVSLHSSPKKTQTSRACTGKRRGQDLSPNAPAFVSKARRNESNSSHLPPSGMSHSVSRVCKTNDKNKNENTQPPKPGQTKRFHVGFSWPNKPANQVESNAG